MTSLTKIKSTNPNCVILYNSSFYFDTNAIKYQLSDILLSNLQQKLWVEPKRKIKIKLSDGSRDYFYSDCVFFSDINSMLIFFFKFEQIILLKNSMDLQSFHDDDKVLIYNLSSTLSNVFHGFVIYGFLLNIFDVKYLIGSEEPTNEFFGSIPNELVSFL
jgi:hypothetical protein